jgi:hypothetical protein
MTIINIALFCYNIWAHYFIDLAYYFKQRIQNHF